MRLSLRWLIAKGKCENNFRDSSHIAEPLGGDSVQKNKRFNITGICVPGIHYMVDISTAVDEIVRNYVENGELYSLFH